MNSVKHRISFHLKVFHDSKKNVFSGIEIMSKLHISPMLPLAFS